MAPRVQDPTSPPKVEPAGKAPTADTPAKREPNPPRTTTGWLTTPKFGSAGSGGAELEPGIDVD